MLGRQVDTGNALIRQITLESNDVDQIGFAKEHPDMVANGMRRFSMDTYSASKAGPNGTATQTQALIGFMDGQPSYDDTKARMLNVANGDAPPVGTRSGVHVESFHPLYGPSTPVRIEVPWKRGRQPDRLRLELADNATFRNYEGARSLPNYRLGGQWIGRMVRGNPAAVLFMGLIAGRAFPQLAFASAPK